MCEGNMSVRVGAAKHDIRRTIVGEKQQQSSDAIAIMIAVRAIQILSEKQQNSGGETPALWRTWCLENVAKHK